MEHKFIHQNKEYSVKIDNENVYIGDKIYKIEILSLMDNVITFNIDGQKITAYVATDKDNIYVFIDGNYFVFSTQTTKPTIVLKKIATESAPKVSTVGFKENSACAPMPGSIVKIFVKKGDKVKIGQVVAIVEAMKMENEVKAPISGTVKNVNFKNGDQVDALQPIVEIE